MLLELVRLKVWSSIRPNTNEYYRICNNTNAYEHILIVFEITNNIINNKNIWIMLMTSSEIVNAKNSIDIMTNLINTCEKSGFITSSDNKLLYNILNMGFIDVSNTNIDSEFVSELGITIGEADAYMKNYLDNKDFICDNADDIMNLVVEIFGNIKKMVKVLR